MSPRSCSAVCCWVSFQLLQHQETWQQLFLEDVGLFSQCSLICSILVSAVAVTHFQLEDHSILFNQIQRNTGSVGGGGGQLHIFAAKHKATIPDFRDSHCEGTNLTQDSFSCMISEHCFCLRNLLYHLWACIHLIRKTHLSCKIKSHMASLNRQNIKPQKSHL